MYRCNLALRMLRQEGGHKSDVSLGYIDRCCLKKTLKRQGKLDVVTHTGNSSIWETELHGKICLKKQRE